VVLSWWASPCVWVQRVLTWVWLGLCARSLLARRWRRRNGGRHVHGALEPLRWPAGHGAQGRGQGLLLPAGPYRAGELPNSTTLSSGRLFRLYDFASGLSFCAVVSGFRCGVSGDQPGWSFCGPVQRNSASHGAILFARAVLVGLEGFAPFRPLLGPAAVPPVWWVHWPAGESSGVYLVGSENLGFRV